MGELAYKLWTEPYLWFHICAVHFVIGCTFAFAFAAILTGWALIFTLVSKGIQKFSKRAAGKLGVDEKSFDDSMQFANDLIADRRAEKAQVDGEST